MYVEVLEVAGFFPAAFGMRLSRKSQGNGDTECGATKLGTKDEALARKLMLRGDEHGKMARYIQTWLYIFAQRDWWQEMDTYTVGVEGWLSESTMYTLEREVKGKTAGEVRKLFPDWVSDGEIAAFLDVVDRAEEIAELAGTTPKLVIKGHLPESFYQGRVGMFSLQALQRIWRQRRDHEHHEWQEFFRQLFARHPFADLIFLEE